MGRKRTQIMLWEHRIKTNTSVKETTRCLKSGLNINKIINLSGFRTGAVPFLPRESAF